MAAPRTPQMNLRWSLPSQLTPQTVTETLKQVEQQCVGQLELQRKELFFWFRNEIRTRDSTSYDKNEGVRGE